MEKTTLSKFRGAFYDYLATLKVQMPDVVKSVDDFQFTIFWMKYIAPYKDNYEEGYSRLREFILENGQDIPALKEEEKNKIIRFVEAINAILHV